MDIKTLHSTGVYKIVNLTLSSGGTVSSSSKTPSSVSSSSIRVLHCDVLSCPEPASPFEKIRLLQ